MTMRERMARALYAANTLYTVPDADSEPVPIPWDCLPAECPTIQQAWLEDADAVLDAMREPTEAMLKRAATTKLLQGWQGSTATEAEGEHIWQAMIDAAKEER